VTGAQASVDSATAKLSSDQAAGASSAQLASDQANVAAAQAQLASAQASLGGTTLTAPIDGTVAAVNLTVGQQLSGTGTGGTNLSGSSTGSGRTSTPSGSSNGSNGFGGNGGNGGNSTGSSSSGSSSSSSSSSTPQIQMISTGSYVVNVNVDDTQVGRIAVGQAATVAPSSSPGTGGRGGGGGFARFFGGGAGANTTTTIDNSQAQAAQGALGTQSQTTSAEGTVTSVGAIATNTSGVASFPVVVTLTNTPSGFFAGATVNVAITYNKLDNVLQVPTLAITRSNGQSFVTVSKNGQKSQQAVTTGITSGGFTQITDGLSRGDLVVVTIPTQVAGNNTNGGARTGGTGGGGLGGGGGGLRGGGGGGGFVRPGD
jgi:multidrug efflux pump subunit AcrA (membrane-fusion protein)